MPRPLTLLLAALACSSASADEGKWFLSFHTGRSVVWIGGEDEREAFAMGIGYSRPDPRMKAGTRPGNLDLYLYFERSWSTPQDDVPHVASDAVGFLAAASWEDMWTKEFGTYLRLGWGIQVQNRTSNDLDSVLNSSPVLGFGMIFRCGSEFRIGVDYLHLSNGGTAGRNLGQNQLMVSLTVRVQ
ncbi:MAG: acyloxyacyl hydrolase [Fimbriimonadales bacterium]|nr:acyloxyacyl hydrolase [Fimbriimonadales bacterium]